MRTSPLSSPATPLRNGPALHGPGLNPCAHVHRPSAAVDNTFVEMLAAYRGSGGLARADEVVALLERGGRAGIATLARWIVERSVISFEWQQQTWLPWFQFQRADQQPDPAMRAVFAELGTVYDGWEMAHWFARPNSALGGSAPLQIIATEADAVLHAARADRFVAEG
jgi:Protein of unknown function (DUF2384)